MTALSTATPETIALCSFPFSNERPASFKNDISLTILKTFPKLYAFEVIVALFPLHVIFPFLTSLETDSYRLFKTQL